LIITKILRHSRHRNRYNIYLDGTLAFDVSDEVLQKFDLRLDQRIDDAVVERVATAEAEHRARQNAFRYISYRPRSAKEVTDHLVKKGFTRELAQKVTRHLQQLKYIDDTEFAHAFVRDRLKRRPSGYSMLRHLLIIKGISPATVEKVLKEYVSDDKQLEAALQLARKRLESKTGESRSARSLKQQTRLFNYLLRRGFSAEIAQKTVHSLLR
jgi:regulatory protein